MARSNANQRPLVTLAGAMSLDGKIATKTGNSNISSRKDLMELHKARTNHDAVMIGIGTLLHDNPQLTVRHVKGKTPIRIIVDSAARTPPNAHIFRTPPGVIVAVSNRASKERIRSLRQAGADIIQTGRDSVNLRTLMSRLYQLGIRSVLLEGGGTLNWSMVSNQLVDKITVTIAPFIIGGRNATTLVDGKGVSKIDRAIALTPVNMRRQGREILLTYRVR